MTILQVGNSPERLAAIVGGKSMAQFFRCRSDREPRVSAYGCSRICHRSTRVSSGRPLRNIVVDRKEARSDPELSFGLRRGIRQFKTNKQVAYNIISQK